MHYNIFIQQLKSYTTKLTCKSCTSHEVDKELFTYPSTASPGPYRCRWLPFDLAAAAYVGVPVIHITITARFHLAFCSIET